MTHGLSILGATGSIGTSTLRVVRRFPDRFRVAGLAAGRASEALADLAREFRPEAVALRDSEEAERFREAFGSSLPDVEILGGSEGLEQIAVWPGADRVISAVVGAAGLPATLAALRAGRAVGLANKESLVAAGAIMTRAAAASGGVLIPVDSEHAAIHQCLEDGRHPFRRLWLTASGGPFRTLSLDQLRDVTLEQALQHPTWRMGPKITIDSATMMNKGLEMIEARWLFEAAPEQVSVVVHPQSTVHSMVEFEDGTLLAQLGATDMRTPIQYALTWPERLAGDLPRFGFAEPFSLQFEPPDPVRFPCLRLAAEALAAGGDAPAVLNAANEVAVAAFLAERIRFLDVPRVVEETLERRNPTEPEDLEAVAASDSWARRTAAERVAFREAEPTRC